jgi:hypothetical protein
VAPALAALAALTGVAAESCSSTSRPEPGPGEAVLRVTVAGHGQVTDSTLELDCTAAAPCTAKYPVSDAGPQQVTIQTRPEAGWRLASPPT